MDIPKEYTFSPGIHGSAWKYCCSLIGAAPTPYYKVGQIIKHPKYGTGTVAEIKQDGMGIRLLIDFEVGQKVIDQAWLMKHGK